MDLPHRRGCASCSVTGWLAPAAASAQLASAGRVVAQYAVWRAAPWPRRPWPACVSAGKHTARGFTTAFSDESSPRCRQDRGRWWQQAPADVASHCTVSSHTQQQMETAQRQTVDSQEAARSTRQLIAPHHLHWPGWAQRIARCAAAAVVAAALAGPAFSPAAALAFGQGTADGPFEQLQRTLRQADRDLTRGLRTAHQSLADSLQTLSAAPQTPDEAAEAQQDGEQLVWEVWDVVDREFLDARQTGFDRDQWAAARDAALAGPLDSPAAAHKAVRSMIARALRDPYTKFISPQDFDDMKAYDVTGVGLNLGTAEEFARKVGAPFPPGRQQASDGIWVVGIIKGSAAEVAGIRQGDELVAVDGAPFTTATPYQVSAMLAGSPGADGMPPPPRLTLAVRDANGAVHELAIPRTVRVSKPTVRAAVEDRNGRTVGRLRIAAFTGRTQAEVADALRQFQQAGATEVELDLRGNLGGLVSQGVETARLFLEEGATIVVKEEGREAAQTVVTATGPALSKAPLTVLVDGDTASAAEILAGALKDNCRGLLVGSRTYGKGLIQSIYELHDASGLALTVGRYRTPGGADIDRTGILPDFRSPPSPEVAAARLRACTPPPSRTA